MRLEDVEAEVPVDFWSGPAPVRGYRGKDRRIGDATDVDEEWQLAILAIHETFVQRLGKNMDDQGS